MNGISEAQCDRIAESMLGKLGPILGEPVLDVETIRKTHPKELAAWKQAVREAIAEVQEDV